MVNTGKMCQQLHKKIYTFLYTIQITGSPSELYNIYPCSSIHLIVAYTKIVLTVEVKTYCSLQIRVLSYVLKSISEEVWSRQANMTVKTHAARAVQLIACNSHAHSVSKAGSVIGGKSPSPVFKWSCS